MLGELEAYRERPIPDLRWAHSAKKGYQQWPIDTADARYREGYGNIRDCGLAGTNFYNRTDNPPYYRSIPGSTPHLYLRMDEIERLHGVNAELNEAGLELFVHDAWRPQAVQTYFHDVWFPEHLRKIHPDWTDERVLAETERYWAKGFASEDDIDPASPPPHSTGGVLDLTIRWIRGDPLWMGTIFDDGSKRAHPDFFERAKGELSPTDDEARKNRRLLYWLMIDAGFQVNPTEWWHFSRGDQMWAKLETAEHGVERKAFYSAIRPI
jgi:D-alanyl-D-alanine dipeptidase